MPTPNFFEVENLALKPVVAFHTATKPQAKPQGACRSFKLNCEDEVRGGRQKTCTASSMQLADRHGGLDHGRPGNYSHLVESHEKSCKVWGQSPRVVNPLITLQQSAWYLSEELE